MWLVAGPGALASRVVEDERGASLRIGIPDVLARDVRIPGRGHELEEPAGPTGPVDGQRVVAAFALGHAQRPAEPGAVAPHGIDRGQAAPAGAGRRRHERGRWL